MESAKGFRDCSLKMEIIPPPRCSTRRRESVTCLCCRKQVAPSEGNSMEYGICEECISRP
jgi:hypothetical protein